MQGVDIVEFGPLTTEQKKELEGEERDPFDAKGLALQYRPKDQHVGLRDEEGRLIASTGMLVVEVDVRGERFPVVGLGGVIVNARHRGRGLGREIVQAALLKASSLGPAFAVLFCHRDRAGLYRKLGFTKVDAGVRVRQVDGHALMPQETMWRPLRANAVWPPGPVALDSLPF